LLLAVALARIAVLLGASVNGKLESMVVQACMVSGEPLSSSLYTEFECVLAEAGDSQSLALLSELDNFDIEEVG
jgi:hypothetical protein